MTGLKHDVNTQMQIPFTHCYEDTTKLKSHNNTFACFHYCNITEATIDMRKWKRYLETQITAAYDASKDSFPPGCHTIMVKFMIDSDGSIQDVSAMSFDNSELAKIAVDVIRKGPRWQPEKQNGKASRSYRTQPVIFMFEDDPEIKKQPDCDTTKKELIL